MPVVRAGDDSIDERCWPARVAETSIYILAKSGTKPAGASGFTEDELQRCAPRSRESYDLKAIYSWSQQGRWCDGYSRINAPLSFSGRSGSQERIFNYLLLMFF